MNISWLKFMTSFTNLGPEIFNGDLDYIGSPDVG